FPLCDPVKQPRYFLFKATRRLEVPLLRVMHGCAWCLDVKYRMHLVDSFVCRFCRNSRETVEHLLFHCPEIYCPEERRVVALASSNLFRWKYLSRRKLSKLSELLSSFTDK